MARKGKKGKNMRAPCNAAYKAEQRWVINKLRKMVRALKDQPNDKQTASRLGELAKRHPSQARQLGIG